MTTLSQNMLSKLPDFDDLIGIADKLSDILARKLMLENEIKSREAEIIKNVITNPVYFVGGKPPSMQFSETAYLHTGLNGELIEKRNEQAQLYAEAERLKLRLEIYKELFSTWRSVNASERAVNV